MKAKKLPPLKAIKKFCHWCSGDSWKEVKLCPRIECELYPYRFGRNPSRKGVGGVGNVKNLALSRVKTAESGNPHEGGD